MKLKLAGALARATHVLALALLVSAGSAGLAQQPPCSVELNIRVPDLSPPPRNEADLRAAFFEHGLVMPEGAGGDSLTADAFFARDDKRVPARVLSVTIDRGPRRIVFVVENGKRMTPAGRKIEAAVISGILSHARAQDSFALISARGFRLELPLGSSREAVRAAAQELANPPPRETKGQPALDAIEEATAWLAPPKAGDAIFVVATNIEGRHSTGMSKVRDSLARGRVRVFSFELAGVPQPDLREVFHGSDTLFNIPDIGLGNVDHLDEMTRYSGGLLAFEEATEGKQNIPTEDRLKGIMAAAQRMYQAATGYYVLGLDSNKDLTLGLVPSVQNRLPGGALVFYPRTLAWCSNPTIATPVKAKSR
jgi:hypothetical protein